MSYTVAVTDTAFSKSLSTFTSELDKYGITTCIFDPEIDDVSRLAGYDAIAVQQLPFNRRVVRHLHPGKCNIIIKFGVGYENLDLAALTEAGIKAANVPDYGPGTVAQHTMFFILSLAKHGIEYHYKMLNAGDLDLVSGSPGQEVWTNESRIPSVSLDTCTLGIIGYGRIGKKVAELARPVFKRIIACDPYIEPPEFEETVEQVDMDTLLSTSEFVTLHVPLFRERQEVYSGYPDYRPKGIFYEPTFHLIDDEKLSRMKNCSFIINTSRGGIVRESAVINALKSGKLAGAALDVYENEPLPGNSTLRTMAQSALPENHPLRNRGQERYNLVLTPHGAYYTEGILNTIEKLMAEEIIRVLIYGEIPKNLINPAVLLKG